MLWGSTLKARFGLHSCPCPLLQSSTVRFGSWRIPEEHGCSQHLGFGSLDRCRDHCLRTPLAFTRLPPPEILRASDGDSNLGETRCRMSKVTIGQLRQLCKQTTPTLIEVYELHMQLQLPRLWRSIGQEVAVVQRLANAGAS